MTPAAICARCGGAVEKLPERQETQASPTALFEDLCLGCLDAVWDAVMACVVERRRNTSQE